MRSPFSTVPPCAKLTSDMPLSDRYQRVLDALYPERIDMRRTSERYDELMDTAQRTGRTIIFSLGVIKAAELVFKKRFL